MFSETQIQILQSLQNGQMLSGNALADQLGLSRTAIWKNIKQLCDKGITIEAIDKQGYQIVGGLDLYNRSALEVALAEQGVGLCCFDSVASTNDCIQFDNAHDWQVAVAEQQTAGRGRRGRDWSSPFAKHIYLSLGFYHRGPLEQLQGLSLVIALAVREVLADIGIDAARVKWPNDIWVESKKIAGILVEMRGEANEGYQVIVGLGLNVHREPSLDTFDAAAVSDYVSMDKTTLIQRLVISMIKYIDQLRGAHFRQFIHAFNDYHVFHQRAVRVPDQDSETTYHVCGVHEDGGIILSQNDQQKIFYASEISMC